MVKFSDNYIKWGVTAVLIGSIAFCMFMCALPGGSWQDVVGITVVLALDVVILVCCKDIAYRTVVVGNTGVREKVFSTVTKEYPWDAVIACGVCSRWVGSYWQYLMFFSDKPVTEKARYGREKEKGKGMGTFITIPLCTDALHAAYTYAPPEVLELLESENHPGNMQALQSMLDKYRKEPRCLLPDAGKEAMPE